MNLEVSKTKYRLDNAVGKVSRNIKSPLYRRYQQGFHACQVQNTCTRLLGRIGTKIMLLSISTQEIEL